MSMIGTALAFLAAVVRPASPEQISAPILASMDTADGEADGPPAPITQAEAERALIDQFIIALRVRPGDFVQGPHTLDDRTTKMEWWTANGPAYFHLWRVGDCSCQNVQSSTSGDNKRAWEAYQKWVVRNANDPSKHPHAHEAVRLWKANQKAAAR